LYRSKFTDEAIVDLKKLPKNIRNALKTEFEKKIHIDPIGCSEELMGPLKDFRSFHLEQYRVVYRVFEDLETIAVVGIGQKDDSHQAEIYKQLETLAQSGQLAKAVLDTYYALSPRNKS